MKHPKTFKPIPLTAVVALAAAALFALGATPAHAANYFNGFETDISGWNVFGGDCNPTRVPSGTDGITSASGSWHAEANTNLFGCFAAGNWGGFAGVPGCASSACAAGSFPPNGYMTSVDVYLNVNGGWADNTRFDFDSAIGQPDGSFRRDFIFNGGFYNDNDGSPGSGTNRFIFSASNNSQPYDAYAKNPGRDPIAIETSGWYTFQHKFYDGGGGVLAVDLSIIDSSGNVVHTWTLSDPSDIIDVTVGGNQYGWFDYSEFSVLAFDNSQRMDLVGDSDGDGIPDSADACPNSDLGATVVIDGCDSGVDNTLGSDGCTVMDQIDQCGADANNHGDFVSCVSSTTNGLNSQGSISGKQKGAIQSCAGKARIP